ncbi:MAG TPA: PIN domain-containing protein [Phycisphaerae bacterium]|nr:PIN domain-containing protein [Phycisphaerae bacterium]
MPDLIDSSVVIDAAKDHPEALAYVRQSLLAGSAALHAVTLAEVIVGTRDSRELFRLRRILRPFDVEYPVVPDGTLALEYLGRLHLSHDVDLPDCLIASTALRLDHSVVTVNDRHFRLFKGLKVIRPY